MNLPQLQSQLRGLLETAGVGRGAAATRGEPRPTGPSAAPSAQAAELAAPAPASLEAAFSNPARPAAQGAAAPRADTIRLSRQALVQLAEQILRTMADAATGKSMPIGESEASSPQRAVSTEAVEQVMRDPGLRSRIAEVFTRPEVIDRLPAMLEDPATREATARLLARPEMSDVARAVLQRPETPEIAAQLLANTATRDVAAQILRNSGSPNLANAVVERLETPSEWRALLESAAGREVAVDAMARSATARAGALTAVANSPEVAGLLRQALASAPESGLIPELLATPATRGFAIETLAYHFDAHALSVASERLAGTDVASGLARVLERAAPAGGSSPPGAAAATEASDALRLLARPEMAALARKVFSAAAAREYLARVLAAPASLNRPETQSALSRLPEDITSAIRLLSHPGMAETARSVFSFTNAAQVLGDLLAPENGRIGALESDAVAALRILARPEMAETARAIFARPDVASRTVEFLGRPDTARLMLEVLTNPEARDLLRRIAADPEAQRALARAALSPQHAVHAPALLREPAVTEAILAEMTRPDNLPRTARLLAEPTVREALQAALANPRTQEAAARLLAEPRLASITREVLQSPSGRAAAATLADAPPGSTGRQALAHILGSRELAVAAREAFTGTQGPARLAALLQDPATRTATLAFLGQSGNGDLARQTLTAPGAWETVVQVLASAATGSRAASSETTAQLGAALRVLAQPENAARLEAFTATPRGATRLAQLLGNPATREETVRLLEQPHVETAARRVLESPEGRRAVERMSGAREGPAQLARLAASPEAAREALREIATLTDPRASRAVLSTPALLSRAADLIENPDTRAAMLRILAQPEMADFAARVLSRADVQERIARLMLDPAFRAAIRPALGQAPMRPVVEQLAATLANAAPTTANADARAFLLEILRSLPVDTTPPSARTPREAGTDLAGRPLAATLLENLPAPPAAAPRGASPLSPTTLSPEAIRAFIARAFSANATVFEAHAMPTPPTTATLGKLAASLERLLTVSPRRAETALATLAAVAETGGAGDRQLRQIAERLETTAARLALKGGLPPGTREPELGGGPALTLRFGVLSETQLAQMVRGLLLRGVQVQFVGRAVDDAVQIHAGLGRTPSATSGSATTTESGLLAHRGLSSGDVQTLNALLGAMGDPRAEAANRPYPTGLAPLAADDPAIATTASRPEIVAARFARDLLAAPAPGTGAPLGPELLTLLRPDAPVQFAFNYALVALFPWFDAAIPPSMQALEAGMLTEAGELIPTMLDLVACEPPLLGYVPDEIMIPGTDIPLFYPPDQSPNRHAPEEFFNRPDAEGIFDAEIIDP